MPIQHDVMAAQALAEWAEQIAGLEVEAARKVADYARGLADNPHLAKSDREFAAAQAEAIRKAMQRVARPNRKRP